MTAAKARSIREEYAAGAEISELAERWAATVQAVRHIVSGRRWPDAGGPVGVRQQERRKLSDDQVRALRRQRDEGGSVNTLATEFGVSPNVANQVARRLTYRTVSD